jgi:hypothetical protein
VHTSQITDVISIRLRTGTLCIPSNLLISSYFRAKTHLFGENFLKGHGNEAEFLGFLQKFVPHESLTLPFEPFRFLLRIRGEFRIRKRLPAITDTGSHRLRISVIWGVADSPHH